MKKILLALITIHFSLITISCDYENHWVKKQTDHMYNVCKEGHTPGTPQITPATCIDDGLEEISCTVCKKKIASQIIPALGGAHEEGTPVVTPATCVTDGSTNISCNICNAVLSSDLINALGHNHTSSLICKNTPCTHQYEIGDEGPGGGIIYYIADGQDGRQSSITVQAGTGFTAYTAYYLEAAQSGSSTSAQWGAFGTQINGVTTFTATSDAGYTQIGNGRKDTQVIVTHLGTIEINRAAQLASSANFGGKNDWFLPSLGELYQLYLQRDLTGIGITTGFFWSSSQNSSSYAWDVDFGNGNRNYANKFIGSQVRAIRAF